MLAAAERGLALDPGHVRCLNLRASALRQLGQADEAAEALEYALAEDPDEPDTHATYGFASLQRGKVHEALTHFREALRLAPVALRRARGARRGAEGEEPALSADPVVDALHLAPLRRAWVAPALWRHVRRALPRAR